MNFYIAIYFPANYDLHIWCHIIKISTAVQISRKTSSRAKIGNKQKVMLKSLTKFGIRADINKSVCEEGWVVRDTMSA